MQERYISVDIEAAGPVPPTYSMLALGAVPVDDLTAGFYVELKPTSRHSMPEAMKVIGRTLDDFTRDGVDPEEAMGQFRDWLNASAGSKRLVFVGFNAVFDWAFVNSYFLHYLGANPFGIGGIDIKSYYMGMVGCPWEATRSSRIPAKFKGGFQQHTHNALDDAIEQGEIFRRLQQTRS